MDEFTEWLVFTCEFLPSRLVSSRAPKWLNGLHVYPRKRLSPYTLLNLKRDNNTIQIKAGTEKPEAWRP